MSGVGFRGVGAGQDGRFTNKEQKLLKSMKFPKEYELPVTLKKVNWEVMKVWIANRCTALLNVEDEVLIGYIMEQLEGIDKVDPRILQINLTGFLEKNTSLFVKELWEMLSSASENPSGIPQSILDEKAEEIRAKKERQNEINEKLKKDREKRDAERRERREREDAEREKHEAERRERRREAEKRDEAERKEREELRKKREKEREEEMEQRRAEREKELARERERRQELERARERERDSRARPRDYDRRGDRGDERRRDRSPVGIRGRLDDSRSPRREDRYRREDVNGRAGPARQVEGERAKRRPRSASTSPEDSGRALTNGRAPADRDAGPPEAVSKKEKKKKDKEKKSKDKKEKKEKKAKKKKRKERDSSPDGDDKSEGTPKDTDAGCKENAKALEEKLRQEALARASSLKGRPSGGSGATGGTASPRNPEAGSPSKRARRSPESPTQFHSPRVASSPSQSPARAEPMDVDGPIRQASPQTSGSSKSRST